MTTAASFAPHSDRPRLLILADEAGITAAIGFAASLLSHTEAAWLPLVLLGATDSFPFRPRPSTILVPGIPDGTIACAPQLDEFGIASRLASTNGLPGCFDGSVIELTSMWLEALDADARAEVEIFACGQDEFLQAASELADRFAIARQLAST
jgi:dihydroorotate dehydrogenase electron transfer subunit